ncbi:MAG: exosortase B [Rubrivivax sp.]|nr:MAG: exosortase B [Rubrivivax sp.]
MAQSATSSRALPSNQAPVQYPVWSLGLLLIALAVMYFPTFVTLANTVWATDEQGHGPLILAASAWLFWTMRIELFRPEARPALGAGFPLLLLGLAMYVVGRSQQVIEFEAASLLLVLMACMLLLLGWRGLKKAWFPFFFLVFMIPMPGAFVQFLTLPLKSAVSVVAEQVLYMAGYPIGRTGVTLSIGPYQLLVADACSGLNSLFTLESLGLLYMNIMNYQSKARNVILAICIVPISFIANVSRVMVLVLITYYFGDEAGQGFAHGFAGLVLFAIALILTYGMDRILAARFDDMEGARRHR